MLMGSDKKILRIFPRKTNETPDDKNVVINRRPGFFDTADEIHISVTFLEDIPRAERLERYWKYVAPTFIGGPAYSKISDSSKPFVPGMYLKRGAVITSRGCNNQCWFCYAWKREGKIVELPINEGHRILDNNILACSIEHQKKVYEMLAKQKEKPIFSGGLESAKFTEWHAEIFSKLNLQRFMFAYDTPDDWEPLIQASKILEKHDLLKGHKCLCYVLIGYPKDTFEKAEQRLMRVISLKMMPFAMLYNKAQHQKENDGWVRFQWEWSKAIIVGSKMRKYHHNKAQEAL